MTTGEFHLNMLKSGERVSSSPVRLRIIIPLLSFFAAIGMILWWGSLFAQRLIVQSRLKTLAAENESRLATEAEAKAQHAEFLEQASRLKQLDGYAAGVRRIGPALASLAENMPIGIQLINLEIEEPGPQNLRPPVPRMPPLRGPTNTVERQTLVIEGRTAKPLYADKLKLTLRDSSFAPIIERLTSEKSRLDTTVQPKKHETRPTLFRLEYEMPPRTFAAAEPAAAGKAEVKGK
ncbi:MAG: hypothetical protein J6T01_01155 [Kiritimatiellae bacterium]|nr:hypothetical protein [Kiritimatiellia bacterium]